MNKGIIFAAGAFVGAAAGSIITFFAVKNHFEDKAAEAIMDYSEYADNKIQEALDSLHDEEEDEEPIHRVQDNRAWSEEDEAPIKKYHHYVPEKQTLISNGIFAKEKDEVKKVTEGEKALQENPARFDDPEIVEISEDKYQEIMSKPPIEGWSADDLTYLYPQDELYWGYGTDNEELAEKHYGVGRETIIGQIWRWATDYTDNESGVGYAYIDNSKLKKVFNIEVIVDLDLEEDE